MKACVKCKNELPDSAIYCGYCGTEQPPIRPEPSKTNVESFAPVYRPSTVTAHSKYPALTSVAQSMLAFADFVEIAGFVCAVLAGGAVGYYLWDFSKVLALVLGALTIVLNYIGAKLLAMLMRMTGEFIYMSIDIEGHIGRIASRN